MIFSCNSQKYSIVAYKKNSGACAFSLPVADIGKFHFKIVKTGRVEMWRGGIRFRLAVSVSFV
jgi:hypothetical protein